MENIHQDMIIEEDEARAGVTGHNVRYVLAFGLAGIVTAFAAIAIYNGYDRISAALADLLARDPLDLMWGIAPYALILVLGVVAIYLLLVLWSLISGPTDNATQSGMRARVVAQFTLICALMAGIYLAAG